MTDEKEAWERWAESKRLELLRMEVPSPPPEPTPDQEEDSAAR